MQKTFRRRFRWIEAPNAPISRRRMGWGLGTGCPPPQPTRGSHYCGGQSRAGASTLSHTPGRTSRKTQWHVTVLLAVLSQRWMHHDGSIPTTTKAWVQTKACITTHDECTNEFRRQWRRRPSRPRPHALTINGSLIFINVLIGYDLSDRQ